MMSAKVISGKSRSRWYNVADKTKAFQFGKKRLPKGEIKASPYPKPEKQAELPIREVQGKMPDSRQEYYVALALDRLQLPYTFQYSIDGGTRIRGGQVLDFLVHTRPLATVLEIYGSYWHEDEATIADALQEQRVKDYFGGSIQYKVIWEQDLQTPDEAYATVRREFIGI